MPKHIIAQGLFFGDESKGSIVDSLTRQHKATLNIRTSGGCQAAHNVQTPEGIHHTFSQFGSGTFAGAKTLLGKDVLVDPLRLMKEGKVLISKGVYDAYDRMSIDGRVLVITPYHAAINQMKEVARGRARHGSCGVGIGETAAYALDYPHRALRIQDLGTNVMRPKLEVMHDRFAAAMIALRAPLMDAGLLTTFDAIKSPFNDTTFMDALCWRYQEFTRLVKIVNELEVNRLVHRNDCIFEGAQGILLDEDYGFHPYITWSRVTSRNAVEMLKSAGIDDWETIGIMRSYAHRHGAGPFPTETKLNLPESHNQTNDWQGGFRVGELDLAAIHYAMRVQVQVGDEIDYLAVTHLDAPVSKSVVTGYECPIDVLDPDDFAARELQTNNLLTTNPSEFRREYPEDRLGFISDFLKAPIGITSNGPAHQHKSYLEVLS